MKAPFNSDSLYKVDSISLAIFVGVLQAFFFKEFTYWRPHYVTVGFIDRTAISQ